MSDIIDFRTRPPALSFLDARIYTRPDIRNRFTKQIGYEPAPSAEQKSMDLYFQEANAAGIVYGVCVGRNTTLLGAVSNADVAAIAKDYPNRFCPVGSIESPTIRGMLQQYQEIRDLGMTVLNLEPGVWAQPLYADDRLLYPLYERCEADGTVLLLMTGGNAGPDISYTDPQHIDRVLADFPALQVVATHGNWPHVQEIIHIAFRRPNLWLSPDMYLNEALPGLDEYLAAAKGFLQDRFLFGTAYPMAPMVEYCQWFTGLPIAAPIMDKILYQNAARLLQLQPATGN
ncbi:amidohydrolase family protein [Parapusillimonas granuli]|uniref:Amidohydrolase family protein n=1 Tax=Parapusillimonas granuli TaxID=380911 RepID=A0A853G054_9BURK|nr:amidohydrolase family protein [Parapusillimonas granuli]MBB5215654.1 hypothetical protein [Parapusillimonas granuli]MEB2400965.1 amidohydrolase family protein [Alcaligenaceae bacterium]NYT49679.1 amidohydrolase family protein [Parapusillimonas granuli]